MSVVAGKSFHPGRVRLRDVDPRRAMQRSEALAHQVEESDERANCSRVWRDCKIEMLKPEVAGRAEISLMFTAAVGLTTIASPPEPSPFKDICVSPLDEGAASVTLEVPAGDAEDTAGILADSADDRPTADIPTTELAERSSCSLPPGRFRTNGCASNEYLKQVYMTKCSDLGVHANSGVREFLERCNPCFCCLAEVDLRDLLMRDRGIVGLLPVFHFSRAIQRLSLAGNGIRDVGLRAIVAAFQDSKEHLGLRVLDLSNNPIPTSCVNDLSLFMDMKPSILLVGLKDTAIPAELRQRLLRQCLENLRLANPDAMIEAWELSQDSAHFLDRELWIRAGSIVEEVHGEAVVSNLASCNASVQGSTVHSPTHSRTGSRPTSGLRISA